MQLLEAASVLVAMNQDAPAQAQPDKKAESDQSSASPAASGSSEIHDDYLSSTNTTPPPNADEPVVSPHSKRYSTASSVYSRSYQSTSATSAYLSESAPNGQAYLSHYRQWSADNRPATAGTSVGGSQYGDEDQADLAAAVGLLSCSYGTPKSGPVVLPPDVPPVPPLPAKFLQTGVAASGGVGRYAPRHSTSNPYAANAVDEREDVRMDYEPEGYGDDDDLDRPLNARSRTDEDEEGVFGTMEE